ncbi:hydroxyacylglutathione hydrolase C-terminal domain-containing protein [Rhizobium beringeri]
MSASRAAPPRSKPCAPTANSPSRRHWGWKKETNPFLRAADPAIRRNLVMEGKTNEEVFAEIRKRKDNF